PTASNIHEELSKWYRMLDNSIAEDKNELTILKAFQYADAIIPTLSTELPNFPKDKLTSKLLTFKSLSVPINSLSQIPGSQKWECSIPDDHYNLSTASPSKKTRTCDF
ncbi:34915_t:CDS:2, partial [Racocetra persica]